jgi:hypothetical protein
VVRSQERALATKLDQVISWGGALKAVREREQFAHTLR